MLGLLLIGRPTRPTPPVCCRPSQDPSSPLDTPLDTLEGIIRFGIPVVAPEGALRLRQPATVDGQPNADLDRGSVVGNRLLVAGGKAAGRDQLVVQSGS